MAKRIRWGRVALALTGLALSSCAGLCLLTEPTNPHQAESEALMEAFRTHTAALEQVEPMADAVPQHAVEVAMDALRTGSRIQRGGSLVEVNVGTALISRAAGNLETWLAQDYVSHGELHRLLPELLDASRVRVDVQAMAEEERQLALDAAWAYGTTGRLPVAVYGMNQASLWRPMAQRAPTSGSPAKYLEHRGEARSQLERLFANTLIDAEAARNEVAGLAVLVGMRIHQQDGRGCPEELAELGPPLITGQYAYDGDRCELVLVAHPERRPHVYRAR